MSEYTRLWSDYVLAKQVSATPKEWFRMLRQWREIRPKPDEVLHKILAPLVCSLRKRLGRDDYPHRTLTSLSDYQRSAREWGVGLGEAWRRKKLATVHGVLSALLRRNPKGIPILRGYGDPYVEDQEYLRLGCPPIVLEKAGGIAQVATADYAQIAGGIYRFNGFLITAKGDDPYEGRRSGFFMYYPNAESDPRGVWASSIEALKKAQVKAIVRKLGEAVR